MAEFPRRKSDVLALAIAMVDGGCLNGVEDD